MQYVFKSDNSSSQILQEERVGNGVVEPFFSFDELMKLYYSNTYHRRSTLLKAALLSNIEDGSRLEGQSRTPKQILNSFILNLEIFGNAFIEVKHKNLYLLPTINARVDKEHNIFQMHNGNKNPIEAQQLAYYSPASIFYGEPDYLGALNAISANVKADSFNNAFFDNSGKVDKAIIFENAEPSSEQIKAFQEFFGSNFRGFANAHKTLVITAHGENAKVKIEDLSKIDDLSFEKLKLISRDEIIAAHGVPPRMVGVVSSGGLGGGNELIGQLHSFNQLTIIPKQEEIEWFFDSIGFPIKLKPIDVSNFKEDGELVTALVQNGILSNIEARALLGYNET